MLKLRHLRPDNWENPHQWHFTERLEGKVFYPGDRQVEDGVDIGVSDGVEGDGCHHLYIMRELESGLSKVGTSQWPHRRVHEVQQRAAGTVRVFACWSFTDPAGETESRRAARSVEADIHTILGDIGLGPVRGREWFLIEPERIAQIMRRPVLLCARRGHAEYLRDTRAGYMKRPGRDQRRRMRVPRA